MIKFYCIKKVFSSFLFVKKEKKQSLFCPFIKYSF